MKAFLCSVLIAAAIIVMAIGNPSGSQSAVSEAGGEGLAPVQYVEESRLGVLWGGGACDWEYGCEVDSNNCSYVDGDPCGMGGVIFDSTCAGCTTNTFRETCHNWGLCIPFVSCSECIVEDPVACGKEQLGDCNAGVCTIIHTYNSNCDNATRCHTN